MGLDWSEMERGIQDRRDIQARLAKLTEKSITELEPVQRIDPEEPSGNALVGVLVALMLEVMAVSAVALCWWLGPLKSIMLCLLVTGSWLVGYMLAQGERR